MQQGVSILLLLSAHAATESSSEDIDDGDEQDALFLDLCVVVRNAMRAWHARELSRNSILQVHERRRLADVVDEAAVRLMQWYRNPMARNTTQQALLRMWQENMQSIRREALFRRRRRVLDALP
jgi:hypothetical protein